VARHDVGAGLLQVPIELDPRGLEDASRRLGQFRADAVAGNEGDTVSYGVEDIDTVANTGCGTV
jgi:hypothetical protein